MLVNFYKLIRRLQWGTHLGLAGGKRVKNKLADILLMFNHANSLQEGDLVTGIVDIANQRVHMVSPAHNGDHTCKLVCTYQHVEDY